ncbi:MAG: hypothetical protein IJB00_04020 [Akkermansia sp.]|nr:hypothetical protein [Akkermansia sp.]
MVFLRTVLCLVLILLVGVVGYACAEETHEQLLRISRHPAKVVPRRVLPITPDMAGELEIIHRSEGWVAKDTLLLRIRGCGNWVLRWIIGPRCTQASTAQPCSI